jgi:hypothetical protein
MQALHAAFGIGALVGPSLVGLLGYAMGLQLMALMLVGGAGVVVAKRCVMKEDKSLIRSETDSDGTSGSSSGSGSSGSSGSDLGSEIEMAARGDASSDRQALVVGESSDKTAAEKDIDTQDNSCTTSTSNTSTSTTTSTIGTGRPTERQGEGAARTVPPIVQVLGFMFFFVYVGIETGFGGWVPTFSLWAGVTADESQAAYLTAVFYGALAFGRIASVPLSLYLTASAMIRAQLLVSVIGSFSFFFLGTRSYLWAYVSCSILGAGLSALFPLMLVLPIDYGIIM